MLRAGAILRFLHSVLLIQQRLYVFAFGAAGVLVERRLLLLFSGIVGEALGRSLSCRLRSVNAASESFRHILKP